MTPFLTEGLFEGNHDVYARLAAHDAGDVPASSDIVREYDPARSEALHGAVAGFNLDLAGKRDDVLSSRRRVKAMQMIRRRPVKENSFGRRSEEHTSELQSLTNLVCRLLLEKKKRLKKI